MNVNPAHVLWVGLTTRIVTQPLHSRSGEEESAVKSILGLFCQTRELMEEHPDQPQFLDVARAMLETARPYTARWHAWMTADKDRVDAGGEPRLRFKDEWFRRQFRRELIALQPRMIGFAKAFDQLRQGRPAQPSWINPNAQELAALSKECPAPGKANLGKALAAGIGRQVPVNNGSAALDQINKSEAAAIHARRGTPNVDAETPPVMNATGAGFSGGGIRSATFCLGVAQVLSRRGLLKQFDYVSTVSGGGYFGSFLSAYLGNPDVGNGPGRKEKIESTFKSLFDRGINDSEPPALRHLRNSSRYLEDGSPARKTAGIGIVAAGVLFNLLILLQIPAWAGVLTYLLAKVYFWGGNDLIREAGPWLPPFDAPVSAAVLVAITLTMALLFIFPRVKDKSYADEASGNESKTLLQWNRWFPALALLTLVALAIWLVPVLFRIYVEIRNGLIFTRIGRLTGMFEQFSAVAGVSLTVIFGALAARLKGKGKSGALLQIATFVAGPLLCLFVYLGVGYRLLTSNSAENWPWWAVVAVLAALALWSMFLVNVNTYSPHNYYRDRLSDCYLRYPLRDVCNGEQREREIAASKDEEISRDTLRLTQLNQNPAAPYHLLNTTVNLPNSKSRELRGRNGDFFVFSKLWCGSPATGYFPTTELEAADPHLNLGTVLAISGAAASSNMGWQTKHALRMLMTIANVRLGYWLLNPIKWRARKKARAPGPEYLFREMFARGIHEERQYLNLSDGGHIENLACYELLRRKCKFIVCIDGGMEPSMVCEDLMRLERYAAIDLGIRMHYDVADLKLQSNGYSKSYGTLVKIDYNPPATATERAQRRPEDAEWGWMIYIKLAMIGYGPGYMMDYKRQNPGFPHESTGDQIYDEAQFEAYRSLGESAAESLFTAPDIQGRTDLDLESWFAGLASTILPDNDEAFRS